MKIDFLDELKGKKNLLAFSYGTDSTALFYALLNQCEFDLCLVNYHTRTNSDLEELSARKLAAKWGKKIYIKHANLSENNFESKARELRYKFFDELMQEYDNLILAHNLNDKFEWFLMQLSRGAGLCNLLSFKGVDKRRDYTIIRPLINVSKDEIMEFLKPFKYFVDESNFSTKHTRNYFRKQFANDFIKEFKSGIKNSFKYLENDKESLSQASIDYKGIHFCKDYNSLDKAIKKLGFVSSAKQKLELKNCLTKNNEAELYFGKTCLCFCKYKGLFLAFLKANVKLSKEEKEQFRILKIPKNLRFYLSQEKIKTNEIDNVLKRI